MILRLIAPASRTRRRHAASWSRRSSSSSQASCPVTSPSACSGASRPRSSVRSSGTTSTSIEPVWERYGVWIADVARGDLGRSLVNDETVTATIGDGRQEHPLPQHLRFPPLRPGHAHPGDARRALAKGKLIGLTDLCGHAHRALAARVRARHAAHLRVRRPALRSRRRSPSSLRATTSSRACTRPCSRR